MDFDHSAARVLDAANVFRVVGGAMNISNAEALVAFSALLSESATSMFVFKHMRPDLQADYQRIVEQALQRAIARAANDVLALTVASPEMPVNATKH